MKNRKGQVALFVALIFQILFLFFAMVINVGLLVHHKINLQNSVDLAAYYGAMKQAENMNAIGHINYQIRQSWKLLAWRYRMIGTAGDFTEHPLDKTNQQLVLKGSDDDITNPGANDFYDRPAFCATYVPFKPMPLGENTCKDLKNLTGVKLFSAPKISASFQGFSKAIQAFTNKMIASATNRCQFFGAYNYKLLGQFVVGFNVDQGDRMLLISQISRAMSNDTKDFRDLDGERVSDGIQKTLENNLTSANRSTVKFEIYNSLGSDKCNATGSAPTQPAKWLSPIKIAPGFMYVDTLCNNTNIQPVQKELAADQNTSWPDEVKNNQNHPLYQDVAALSPFIGLRADINDPYNYSVGVEKNPWCMAYVGVSAESTPAIPFSPFGPVKLKARAFFKPFGGRIGPWYEKLWPSTSEKSNGGGKTDANLPPRIFDTSNIGNVNDPTRAANYSRFAGDPIGLKSRNVLFQFGRAIFELDRSWQTASGGAVTNRFDGSTITYDAAPTFSDWDHLPFEFIKKNNGNGDLLAWNEHDKKPSRFRSLELAAILPDQFDMAYYSIEPDYFHNYYKRIKEKFIPKVVPGFDKEVRPDIGYHKDFKGYDEFSVKDQFAVLKGYDVTDVKLDFTSKLTYVGSKWWHVLTGWADTGLLDYSLDTSKFGKCTVFPKGTDGEGMGIPAPPTSGNCVVGGSTGYSVKMISSDYLNSDLQLGGENGGSGPILNPPPADF